MSIPGFSGYGSAKKAEDDYIEKLKKKMKMSFEMELASRVAFTEGCAVAFARGVERGNNDRVASIQSSLGLIDNLEE